MKSGYKQTDAGVIPSDWEATPLGRLVSSVEYGSSAKSRTKGLIPVLRMGNLQSGTINWRDLAYTSDEKEIARYKLRYGDVLFNRTNTIDLVGKAAIYLGEQPAIFAGYLIRVNVIPDRLDSRYLNYILNTECAKKYGLKVLSVAVGQANINGQKLKTYPIPLPPTREEQCIISAALSDVDALLTSLDKLIAKKRDVKQAAMQKLLAGKTRLPGFTGEWELKPLGSFVSIRNQKVMPTDVLPETLCVELEHLGQGSGALLERGNPKSSSAAKYRFCSGDVLFGRLRSYLRKYWLAIEDGICTTEIWPLMFDPRQVSAGFLFALVQTNEFIDAASVSYGTHMPRADWSVIRNFEAKWPRVEEQAAIAEVLRDMDAELERLHSRREKTRLLKQGMMQELLTGKTRLVAA